MSNSALKQTRRSPRTLRDLLNETSFPSLTPSNSFKPIPRNPIPSTTMRSLMEMDSNFPSRNSNTRILNSLLNSLAKKFYSFALKYPTIFPRSVSRRLSRKSNSRNSRGSVETKVPVRIKDIVRWRSFGDLDEFEQSQPLDFSSASSSCSSSKGSSWSDSDFSSCDGNNFAECRQNDVVHGKIVSPIVGVDSVYATTGNLAGPKGDSSLISHEEEQRSPISVLEICEYDEEYNDIDDEKMGRQLLQCAKSSGSVQRSSTANLEKLLLDLFEEEVKKRGVNYEIRNKEDEDDENEFENEILRIIEDWMNNASLGDDFEKSGKNACVRDMDERERWSKFEDEKEQLACEIETDILEKLIVEVFCCSFSR